MVIFTNFQNVVLLVLLNILFIDPFYEKNAWIPIRNWHTVSPIYFDMIYQAIDYSYFLKKWKNHLKTIKKKENSRC